LRVLVLLALYTAALNSKEMAAIAPILLILYELPSLKLRSYAVPLLLCAITAAAMLGKTQAGGPFHGESMYIASFTLKRFFQNARALQSELFYLHPRDLSTRQVLAIWSALLLAPFAIERPHRRALWFSAAFAILGPLPIIFLPGRGFYVMYVPLAGWALYCAMLAVFARDWIAREIRRRLPMRRNGWIAAHAALALCLAYVVTRGLSDPGYTSPHYDPMRKVIAETRSDFASLGEFPPRGARLLLLHSRFPDDAWGPLMIARLLYRDPGLWLDRPAVHLFPAAPDPAAYDLVLDFDGRRMRVVRRR
jgi:hypothetical protein